MGRRREAPARGLTVEVVASVPSGRAAARGLGRWLERAGPRSARGEVGVAIVSDAAMRRLNRTYRRVDRVTDVLSFPAGGAVAGRSGPGARAGRSVLGDIAIARGVAARQARAHGHGLGVEFRVLALHGLLHLLGYDHEADEGRMRRVEERLRRRAGLPSGLTARGSSPFGRRR
ncbi:MAG: rRNA maturation RNase YbeY [Vicinamibacterales bacterium]